MKSNARGSVAVLVLWIVAFFGVVCLILAARVDSEVAVVKRLQVQSQSRTSATSGLTFAVEVLKNISSGNLKTPALQAIHRDNPKLFKEIKLPDGGDGESVSIGYVENGAWVYGLQDEQAKININAAPAAVWMRLFSWAKIPEDRAQYLTQKTLERRNRPIQTLEFGVVLPENTPAGFSSIEELLVIEGFTSEIWEKLKPHLTLYGPGRVNLNTVNVETMQALGLPRDLAERIHRYRERFWGAYNPNSAVQAPFENLGDLEQKIGVGPEEEMQLQNVAALWGFESATFRFSSVVGGHGLECVADKKGRILFLKEI